MEYRIRAYVDELFQSAPRTQRAYELKVELTQNLLDKYFALLSEGKSQDDAYNLTVMSIGDVQELFAGLTEDAPPEPPVPQAVPVPGCSRSALVVTIAVMLYILSVVPLIVLSALFGGYGDGAVLGVAMMFVMIACATGLLIYNHMTKPKAQPYVMPGTVVQDFKEWQSGKSQKKQLMKSIRAAYWPLVLALYFLLSFGTGKWYITWVLFLIAPAVDSIISAVLSLQDRNGK